MLMRPGQAVSFAKTLILTKRRGATIAPVLAPAEAVERTGEGLEKGAPMMGKRLFLAAALAILLTSMGCTRYWCEHQGYYPTPPCQQPCCAPCCPPAATGYAPAVQQGYWNQPAGNCSCPPPH